ncbi:hypothetical protein [Streptomyces lonarensis]|uniref:hypothetical protein n=1 Tax=Streptomyces lonarensis TaxID=700599 RepID=UPI0028A72F00|nr:hypothetical protein [Streptomyces lonarensis]
MSRLVGTSGAVLWLAAAAADPERCRRRWARRGGELVELCAGTRWDALVLPAPLGLESLAVLHRTGVRVGPVLFDRGAGSVSYLVAAGASGAWVGTGVRTLGAGARLAVPRPDAAGGEVRWLVPPDGSGSLTDLGRLESAMHEAVALGVRLAGPSRRPVRGARSATGMHRAPAPCGTGPDALRPGWLGVGAAGPGEKGGGATPS